MDLKKSASLPISRLMRNTIGFKFVFYVSIRAVGGTGTYTFDYSCAASEYAYGIVIDQGESANTTAFTYGLKCRSLP